MGVFIISGKISQSEIVGKAKREQLKEWETDKAEKGKIETIRSIRKRVRTALLEVRVFDKRRMGFGKGW